MSALALICAAVGLALLAYACWRARQHELDRRRDETRIVFDERRAANGLHPEPPLELKATRRTPPRAPR